MEERAVGSVYSVTPEGGLYMELEEQRSRTIRTPSRKCFMDRENDSIPNHDRRTTARRARRVEKKQHERQRSR